MNQFIFSGLAVAIFCSGSAHSSHASSVVSDERLLENIGEIDCEGCLANSWVTAANGQYTFTNATGK